MLGSHLGDFGATTRKMVEKWVELGKNGHRECILRVSATKSSPSPKNLPVPPVLPVRV